MVMKRAYYRVGFTRWQSSELWERWKRGEGLKAIGRVFWQAVVLHFQPPLSHRRDKAALSATVSVGTDIGGA